MQRLRIRKVIRRLPRRRARPENASHFRGGSFANKGGDRRNEHKRRDLGELKWLFVARHS
jgi:hypothetical protein